MKNPKSEIPAWLLPRPVSFGAKVLYGCLRDVSGVSDHSSYTIEQMSKWVGICIRQIRSYLKELSDLGLIEIKRRKSDSNPSVYFIVEHPWMLETIESQDDDNSDLCFDFDSEEYLVYLIRAGDGPIKIGVAIDPQKRLSEIQVGNPLKLELLASVPGDQNTERLLHRKFSAHRMSGEWFSPEPELLEVAKKMQSGTFNWESV